MNPIDAYNKYIKSRCAVQTPQELLDKVERDAFLEGFRMGQDEILNIARAVVTIAEETKNGTV